MGYDVKIEHFTGITPEAVTEFTASGWEGVADSVADLVETYGLPSGTEGWNEGGCVQGDHDCDKDPDTCREYAVDAIREWIGGALEQQGQTSLSFHFNKGQERAALTAYWNGKG